MIDQADSARQFDNVTTPDPRMAYTALDTRIAWINGFHLGDDIPEEIRIHFATGKNLYIYAWFAYRFHMVAEHHILSTLEMALKTRLQAAGLTKPPRGLHLLLRSASDRRLIENDRLAHRWDWALELARDRYRMDMTQTMIEQGLSECRLDYAAVTPVESDLQFDWIGHFTKTIPAIRNEHAHGSDMLHPTVSRTFEIVTDLINQLFANDRLTSRNT